MQDYNKDDISPKIIEQIHQNGHTSNPTSPQPNAQSICYEVSLQVGAMEVER
jgi:hypothetical protein